MTTQLESPPWGVAQYRVFSALDEILNDPYREQRSIRQLSYFGPVLVGSPDHGEVQISAFARDICAGGIGLVHLMPLAQGMVTITLSLPSGRRVALQTEVLWCRDYGNGWFASGGRFIDVVDAPSAASSEFA